MAKRFLWFDPKVHNSENASYQRMFTGLGFALHPFTDMSMAVDFLHKQPAGEKWLALSCGSSGEQFVGRIEALESVGAILIFTGVCDVPRHSEWAKLHPKICGVKAWVEDVLQLADELTKHVMLAKVVGRRERSRALALWSGLPPSMKDACLAPVTDQQDSRMSCTILPYGVKVERSDEYFRWCTASTTSTLQDDHLKVLKQCYQDLARDKTVSHRCLVSAALMRAYTDDIGERYPDMMRALYQDVNKALRDDDAATLSEHGAFIRLLRCAMKKQCRDLGMNYCEGCVYRQMTIADLSLTPISPASSSFGRASYPLPRPRMGAPSSVGTFSS